MRSLLSLGGLDLEADREEEEMGTKTAQIAAEMPLIQQNGSV